MKDDVVLCSGKYFPKDSRAISTRVSIITGLDPNFDHVSEISGNSASSEPVHLNLASNT